MDGWFLINHGVFQKFQKTGISVGFRRKVVGQQGGIDFSRGHNLVVIVLMLNPHQAQKQCQGRYRQTQPVPPTGLVFKVFCRTAFEPGKARHTAGPQRCGCRRARTRTR